MRILFLCHTFNSLSQRLYTELVARGDQVAVEYDIADAVTEEAVALFRPELIVAPYLRRAIPASVWQRQVCLIVHPGIAGDRGPSALDWAIQGGEDDWGVTVLQATGELDAGPIWATETFVMRRARKSSIYRHEVSEAATRAVLAAVERFASGWRPPLSAAASGISRRGGWRPLLPQRERAIDWRRDSTQTVLRKIDAADGAPGVLDELFGEAFYLFDACAESTLHVGRAGEVVARRETAILRRTVDGAVWIGHLRRVAADACKLPATLLLADRLAEIPEVAAGTDDAAVFSPAATTWQDICCETDGPVGYLHFAFYNGAMNRRQCERLRAAYDWLRRQPVRVIVLLGGPDFWSNGIHLHCIEAATSPADESWNNIQAIDDLAEAIIRTDGQLTVAALQGNCAAGGCFLARAADLVWARAGVVLNPHYRNMGNLYGSEYWTYLLPARVGRGQAQAIMQQRLPMSVAAAAQAGLVDACLPNDAGAFRAETARRAAALASAPDFAARVQAKRDRRARDEATKPLATYRAEELAEMQRNFYGFDASYHVARHHFVHKTPHSWTPRHLALHRDLAWQVPK